MSQETIDNFPDTISEETKGELTDEQLGKLKTIQDKIQELNSKPNQCIQNRLSELDKQIENVSSKKVGSLTPMKQKLKSVKSDIKNDNQKEIERLKRIEMNNAMILLRGV